MEILWPETYKPDNTAIHVSNKLLMPGVELERVWAWLCRCDLWPSWYPNSSNVRIKNQPDSSLRLGTEFRWKTFGVTIDSKVLDKAESQVDAAQIDGQDGSDEQDEESPAPVRKLTKDQQAEQLRKMVDTVGRYGEPGGPIQNVISVGMLSEGWDAKTVTHIMGLRAFSSQLLCEQVVGRGLRRTSYETKRTTDPVTGKEIDLFEPEYVNIFGVPFTFLPHEGGDGPPPPPPPPKTQVEPVVVTAVGATAPPIMPPPPRPASGNRIVSNRKSLALSAWEC